MTAPTTEPATETPPSELAANSPESLAIYDAETVLTVSAQAQAVARLDEIWQDAHAEAAIAKKEFEKGTTQLRNLIGEREYQRGKPKQPTLFDGTTVMTGSTPPDAAAELWTRYPITFARWEQFGLTEKDVERLNSGETKSHGTHPVVKFGDVMRFVSPDPANPAYARSLKDFKGLGDKGYDRWQDAETAFWKYWNAGGDAAFALETGAVNGAETAAGPAGDDRGESLSDYADKPATTDAERTPDGKRAKRKTANA